MKLNLNEPICEWILVTQSQVIDVEEAITYDNCIVPYRMLNVTQETQVINVKIKVEVGGVII